MSRHELTAPDNVEVIVGWDPPLNTFFVQVWDRKLPELAPASELLWVGWKPGEITDIEQVRTLVAPWLSLPDDVFRALYAEAHA